MAFIKKTTCTINVSGLNTPNNRQRLTDWIKKRKMQLYVIYRSRASDIKKNRLKVKDGKR